jgi:hypothetical protein
MKLKFATEEEEELIMRNLMDSESIKQYLHVTIATSAIANVGNNSQ